VQKTIVVPPALTPQSTSSKTNDQSSEIEKLKREVEELKKKPASATPAPKQTTPVVTEKSNPQLVKPTPPPIETWEKQEVKDFAYADARGWTSLISTNSLGEKRYYRKEGTQWVRKNTEAETQQPYVPPPTLEQLANLRRVCLLDATVAAICADPNFMPGYYSNLIFRLKIDELNAKILAEVSNQQRQRITAEKQTLDCLMALTPENERLMDPATQNYLRQLRCGTVTATDRTNYELSRIKSSVDELKYRLDSKISFPSLLLDPIQSPTMNTPRWQIRWEGSGGTVTDSNGGFYQFHCEYNTCRSY